MIKISLKDSISVFCSLTSSSPAVAEQFLAASNWELQRAVDLFLEHPPGDGPAEPHEREKSVGVASGPSSAAGAGAAQDSELARALAESLNTSDTDQRLDAENARAKRRQIILELRKERFEEARDTQPSDASEDSQCSLAPELQVEVNHRAFNDAFLKTVSGNVPNSSAASCRSPFSPVRSKMALLRSSLRQHRR